MSIFIKVILAILVFLAVSSGIMKVLLMPQEVEFFGNYGFTNPILIAYGASQLIGGILLIFSKTRVLGAAIVAVTFLISAVVLFMSNNFPVAIVTCVAILMLLLVMKKNIGTEMHDESEIMQ